MKKKDESYSGRWKKNLYDDDFLTIIRIYTCITLYKSLSRTYYTCIMRAVSYENIMSYVESYTRTCNLYVIFSSPHFRLFSSDTHTYIYTHRIYIRYAGQE